MNYTNLSLDQAPDIWSPLRFFISAPLFAMAAVTLLFISGPEIFQNRWLPQSLAITHLITLGFITMVMVGAAFQLLPVLAGSSIYASKVSSKIIHILITTGVVLLCSGFYAANALWIKLALLFIVPGVIYFLVLSSFALYKARSSFASANGMRLSISSLWIVFILGVLLSAGKAWNEIPLYREFTNLHMIWAALGWVLTMIVAISFQVIPMFQVTKEYSVSFRKWFFIILFSCLLVVTVQALFNDSIKFVYVVLSAILLWFSVVSVNLLFQRKKRLVDSSFYYWLTGLSSLVLSVCIYNYAMIFNVELNALLGVVFFLGFIVSIINGMLFKIVPFLVWLHLNKKLAFTDKGLSSVPTMNEVIGRKKMFRQYVLHSAALGLTILSIFFPAVFFNVAMVFLLASFSLLFLYLLQSVRLYYVCISDI